MAISLKLYVAGKTGIGSTAERNLAAMVEDLRSKVEFEIIDVLEQPAVAVQERILATPALVRTSPPPRRKVIGDLSDKKLVMISLGLDGPLDADKPKWVPKETCHE
jgi:circadian clock protein KaiB